MPTDRIATKWRAWSIPTWSTVSEYAEGIAEVRIAANSYLTSSRLGID